MRQIDKCGEFGAAMIHAIGSIHS